MTVNWMKSIIFPSSCLLQILKVSCVDFREGLNVYIKMVCRTGKGNVFISKWKIQEGTKYRLKYLGKKLNGFNRNLEALSSSTC